MPPGGTESFLTLKDGRPTCCQLCGTRVTEWFQVPQLKPGAAALQLCRECFWRSPARSLTGWSKGVRWMSDAG